MGALVANLNTGLEYLSASKGSYTLAKFVGDITTR
jgi:hypothetical protein